MRSAFFVVAAVIFGDIAHAAAPADKITATHYPAYGVTKDAGGFRVVVNIVVKTPSIDEEPGEADFAIRVRFPDGTEVAQECANEEYVFADGKMEFAPFEEEPSCTADFVEAMNAKFRSMGAVGDTVRKPVALEYNATEDFLLFNSIARAEVQIPAVAPVPKGRLL